MPKVPSKSRLAQNRTRKPLSPSRGFLWLQQRALPCPHPILCVGAPSRNRPGWDLKLFFQGLPLAQRFCSPTAFAKEWPVLSVWVCWGARGGDGWVARWCACCHFIFHLERHLPDCGVGILWGPCPLPDSFPSLGYLRRARPCRGLYVYCPVYSLPH